MTSLIFSLGFGALSYLLKWLTLPASVLVSIMGLVILLKLGWFWSIPPALFLSVGSLLSGTKRDAFQVLANGGAAFTFALLGKPDAYLTALTVGFSDTVATEVGTRLSSKAYLITNFKEVPPGTSGGVSFWGTLSAFITVAAMSVFLKLGGKGDLFLFFASSVVGVFLDSVIGATLEGKGIFGNNMTNLLATSFGSFAYYCLSNLK